MVQFQILQLSSSGRDETGPLVYLNGRTEDNRSVTVVVTGALPYLCIKLEHGLLNVLGAPNLGLVGIFINELNAHLNTQVGHWGKYKLYSAGPGRPFKLIRNWEIYDTFDYNGYSSKKLLYLRVYFGSAAALTSARFSLLECAGSKTRGAAFSRELLSSLFPGLQDHISSCFTKSKGAPYGNFAFTLGEANIEFHNQFCADKSINVGKWVEVLAVPGSVSTPGGVKSDFRMQVQANDVKPIEKDGISPIRTLAFDLEVYCTDLGHGATRFYDADEPEARIICISAVTFDNTAKALVSRVFSIGDASHAREVFPVSGSPTETFEIYWHLSERALVLSFLKFISEYDPDILTGWNTIGSEKAFDWMYLIKRCLILKLDKEFELIGRFGKVKYFIDEKTQLWSEKARIPLIIPGRIVHDMMVWTKRNRQLREYNLDFVSTTFGVGEKDDVSYNQIDALSKTREGRIKLATYCELDSRLVCRLMLVKALDPIGKSVAICCITGVPFEDLIFKGSMNTLRLCLLRVSHQNNFTLSCPSFSDPDPDEFEDEDVSGGDEEPHQRFQGGKVLAPRVGFYTDPVVTLDFGSLYPSIMCELNICKSTQITREFAKQTNLDFTQPPAPTVAGVWTRAGVRVARIDENADDDIKIHFYGAAKPDASARYSNELNKTITLNTTGEVAELHDGGYEMRWPNGETWTRRDADILCFVDSSVFEGIIPKLERTLKIDRKAAKKKLAEAEAAQNSNLAAYYDNLQNSIKVIMNAAYGLLGSGRGGIFPSSAPLASAITARGRSLIVLVKETIESRFWLNGTELHGFEDADVGQQQVNSAEAVNIIYGDTDSCMILLPGCSLAEAAEHGATFSRYFAEKVLKPPHVLEFEKVLMPSAFYKKKMYSAVKFETYHAEAKGKVWCRGLSAIRRDNSVLLKNTVLEVMDLMFKYQKDRDFLIDWIGKRLADIFNSAAVIHDPDAVFTGVKRFRLEDFIQSAGISKALTEYDAPNAAVRIAEQMLIENPNSEVGKNSRVSFVVTKCLKDSKRGDQVLLPHICVLRKTAIDAHFYVNAVIKKLAPLVCVFFAHDEQRSRLNGTMEGATVTGQASSCAERTKLQGQQLAERLICECFRSQRLKLAVAPVDAGGRLKLCAPPKAATPSDKKRKTVAELEAAANADKRGKKQASLRLFFKK